MLLFFTLVEPYDRIQIELSLLQNMLRDQKMTSRFTGLSVSVEQMFRK